MQRQYYRRTPQWQAEMATNYKAAVSVLATLLISSPNLSNHLRARRRPFSFSLRPLCMGAVHQLLPILATNDCFEGDLRELPPSARAGARKCCCEDGSCGSDPECAPDPSRQRGLCVDDRWDLLPDEVTILANETQDVASTNETRELWQEILKRRKAISWNNYYQDVVRYVHTSGSQQNRSRLEEPLVIVEIGTAFGGMANAFLEGFSKATVISVDPFQSYGGGSRSGNLADASDSTSVMYKKLGLRNKASSKSEGWAKSLATHMHKQHGCRWHLLHTTSTSAASRLQGRLSGSIDVVFIDGLHTFHGIVNDMLSWLPLMRRPGGLVIFNDYGKRSFPYVTDVVADLVRKNQDIIKGLDVGANGRPPGKSNAGVVLRGGTPLLFPPHKLNDFMSQIKVEPMCYVHSPSEVRNLRRKPRGSEVGLCCCHESEASRRGARSPCLGDISCKAAAGAGGRR